MTARRRRLAILHSRRTQPGSRHHMVMAIAELLTDMGVEVIHLYGTSRFEPADAILVHVDLSYVPDAYINFARRYPIQLNAEGRDIRKRSFVDGLLKNGDVYPEPVIVKSNLNYGGEPEQKERSALERAANRVRRLVTGAPAAMTMTKEDYRIYPTLADVPPVYFSPDHIIQKLKIEKDGEKNLLREYFFFGDVHFQNIERSADTIITEDEQVSCQPFVPHPRLVEIRKRLKLDYGKLDYVMSGGEPFVFDANKTLGLGVANGEGLWPAMFRAFAGEAFRILNEADTAPR